MHTTASDGRLTPAELVTRAHASGLTTISVTDHDTVAAIADVTQLAASLQMRVVPGIEITAVDQGRDVHMLGYFFDPNDARLAEVLVNQRADDSALGIIINRPTRRTMASLFPEHAPSKKVVDPLYFGGPSGRNAVFGLIRLKQSPGEGALTLLPNLFLALHVDLVDKLIEQYPADARFYVGYAGWGPGQLRSEIERGGWYVLEADPDLIFRKDPQTLWEELIRQEQRTTAMLDCCNPTQP